MLADNTKIRYYDHESGCWQTTLKLAKGRGYVTQWCHYPLFYFYKEIYIQSYSIEEARRIIMQCAKQYDKNLLNKKFLIIYRDKSDNNIKCIELFFNKKNYQHLTGVEMIDADGNVREHVSELFYIKCLNNTLSKKEIRFKKDGTTNLKLAALPIIMTIHKVTKITGDYNYIRAYLRADKLIGNVNFCLGLNKTGSHYVPVSALLENIKNLTDVSSQVLAVFSKELTEDIYKNIRHVAKGVNLNNINLPKDILTKICLDEYIPKC